MGKQKTKRKVKGDWEMGKWEKVKDKANGERRKGEH